MNTTTPTPVACGPDDLDVLTVGESMALFIAGQPGPLSTVPVFQRVAAGAELNVSVGLSRLGFRVGYISRLGPDNLGQFLLDFMRAEGIDTRFIRVDPARLTGLMFKSLETQGQDPKVEYFRRGSAASHMGLEDCPPLAQLPKARCVHLTGISPALSPSTRALTFELARLAREQGRLVSFDPNLRPSLWASREEMVETLNRLAVQADLVMPGLAEGRLLTGRDSAEGIADFYRQQGVSQVVVKLGAEGAYYAGPQGSGIAPGRPVARIVDTVGAGDGFAVGVISALLEGHTLPLAAMRGNAIGARVVQFPGDSDGLPQRSELAAALQGLPAH